jgi:hypothetical protein
MRTMTAGARKSARVIGGMARSTKVSRRHAPGAWLLKQNLMESGGLRTYISFHGGRTMGSENWSLTCWRARDPPRLQLQ